MHSVPPPMEAVQAAAPATPPAAPAPAPVTLRVPDAATGPAGLSERINRTPAPLRAAALPAEGRPLHPWHALTPAAEPAAPPAAEVPAAGMLASELPGLPSRRNSIALTRGRVEPPQVQARGSGGVRHRVKVSERFKHCVNTADGAPPNWAAPSVDGGQ